MQLRRKSWLCGVGCFGGRRQTNIVLDAELGGSEFVEHTGERRQAAAFGSAALSLKTKCEIRQEDAGRIGLWLASHYKNKTIFEEEVLSDKAMPLELKKQLVGKTPKEPENVSENLDTDYWKF